MKPKECPVEGCEKILETPAQARGHASGHARQGRKRGPIKKRKSMELRKKGSYINAGYVYLYGYYGHELASNRGVIAEHRKVLYDAIGPGPHNCWWCGRSGLVWDGSRDGIRTDHLDGVTTNNLLQNLRPSCDSCNRKGARLMQHKAEYDQAGLAQLVAQRSCKHQVTGSSPVPSSKVQ